MRRDLLYLWWLHQERHGSERFLGVRIVIKLILTDWKNKKARCMPGLACASKSFPAQAFAGSAGDPLSGWPPRSAHSSAPTFEYPLPLQLFIAKQALWAVAQVVCPLHALMP